MKKFKIEIQVTLLTICIAFVVIVSGLLAWQSLSRIVSTIHKEARPDLKLLLIKDIASDLNEVENTVRLYNITGDATFIKPFKQLNNDIQEKLSDLKFYVSPGTDEIHQIDSIRLLVNRKLLILDEIRTLNKSNGNTKDSFSKLYSKIDTVIIQPDTIRFKKEEKKGFFKRIFSKRDTTTKQPVIIDKSKEKEIIKKEIAGIEKQISVQARHLQAREKYLLEQNIQVTKKISQLIYLLETIEQGRLAVKTTEVDSLAKKTYQRMAIFTIAAVILLIIILILFFQNLRKNRTTQQVLKKAKSEAEKLAKAKELFVATVSHEMRTPVNAIFGLTEQLLQNKNSNEITTDLNIIQKSAGHLIALVNDTLDFSKIESQTIKLEEVNFLLDELINQVEIFHKDSAQKKGLKLIINNNTSKSLLLKGDPFRLKQILINLLTNAIKFTNHGQVKLDIAEIKTTTENYLLQFEVTDTGIGIPKDQIHLIFDEFVQLNSSQTQKQNGAGLGLSIVKKLVQIQNGEIEVESTPGKGTHFSVKIPFKKGDPESMSQEKIEQFIRPFGDEKMHFLIVDDEEYNLYLIKKILNKWGVSFSETHNGWEAVELAQANSYDLILMDLQMPVMDGFEAAKLIKGIDPNSKIIALSASSKQIDPEKIKKAGISAFLQKPFSESNLLNSVLNLVANKKTTISAITSEEGQTFNLADLERISGGDNVFFNDMLKIFIRSSNEILILFQEKYHISDWHSIAEAAHKLAAPAKHMQATALYKHLKKLECVNNESNFEEIKFLIDAVENEIKTISLAIKQKLESE